MPDSDGDSVAGQLRASADAAACARLIVLGDPDAAYQLIMAHPYPRRLAAASVGALVAILGRLPIEHADVLAVLEEHAREARATADQYDPPA